MDQINRTRYRDSHRYLLTVRMRWAIAWDRVAKEAMMRALAENTRYEGTDGDT